MPAQWVCSLGSDELQREALLFSHEIKVVDLVVCLILGFTNMGSGECCAGDPGLCEWRGSQASSREDGTLLLTLRGTESLRLCREVRDTPATSPGQPPFTGQALPIQA